MGAEGEFAPKGQLTDGREAARMSGFERSGGCWTDGERAQAMGLGRGGGGSRQAGSGGGRPEASRLSASRIRSLAGSSRSNWT